MDPGAPAAIDFLRTGDGTGTAPMPRVPGRDPGARRWRRHGRSFRAHGRCARAPATPVARQAARSAPRSSPTEETAAVCQAPAPALDPACFAAKPGADPHGRIRATSAGPAGAWRTRGAAITVEPCERGMPWPAPTPPVHERLARVAAGPPRQRPTDSAERRLTVGAAVCEMIAVLGSRADGAGIRTLRATTRRAGSPRPTAARATPIDRR